MIYLPSTPPLLVIQELAQTFGTAGIGPIFNVEHGGGFGRLGLLCKV
jgi:hypothetical protein